MRVIVVPHSHWDREWYEPLARVRQRLVAMLDHAIPLLETGDLPVFLLDGQTVLAEDYLGVRPDRRAALGRLVADGKLLVGPWYVLSDEVLPADETLVRNLLIGRRDGEGLGGASGAGLSVGYSPDAFGHPAALPAILAGFGIRHAILWRGRGGEPGEDRDLFRWIGPDGSAVLVHHLPPEGYQAGAGLPGDDATLLERWRGLRSTLAARATAPVLLVTNGADHHQAQADIGAVVRRLAELAPEDTFEIGSPATYFDALPETLAAPEVRGELRWSYRYTWTLQGVHATRSGLKRSVAEGERLLIRWAEPQAALAAAGWADGRTEGRADGRTERRKDAHLGRPACRRMAGAH